MKQGILWATLLSVPWLLGCASSGYLADRGDDLADIFTATIGTGVGAKARAGPLSPALYINQNHVGLQDGDFFTGTGKYGTESGFEGILLIGGEGGNSSELARERDKYYQAFYLLGIASPAAPCGELTYPPSYFTQLEVAAGVGVTFKLGFNPGELLDFLLGWTTIDMYGDDVRTKSTESKDPEVLPDGRQQP